MPSEPAVMEIWRSFYRSFTALVKASREELACHGITGPQFGVLRILQRKGSSSMSELSEELLVTGGNVTGLVDRLAHDKLVIREPSHDDRRVVHVTITEKGQKLVNEALATQQTLLSSVFDDFSSEERKAFFECLRKLETKLTP